MVGGWRPKLWQTSHPKNAQDEVEMTWRNDVTRSFTGRKHLQINNQLPNFFLAEDINWSIFFLTAKDKQRGFESRNFQKAPWQIQKNGEKSTQHSPFPRMIRLEAGNNTKEEPSSCCFFPPPNSYKNMLLQFFFHHLPQIFRGKDIQKKSFRNIDASLTWRCFLARNLDHHT